MSLAKDYEQLFFLGYRSGLRLSPESYFENKQGQRGRDVGDLGEVAGTKVSCMYLIGISGLWTRVVDQMSSSTSRNSTASGAESTTGSISSTISKALSAKSEWSDKDEFLDVIYWFRYVILDSLVLP